MIKFTRGNIFDSPAEAIVCPVNCVGSLGAGLAKQFRNKSKELDDEYKKLCAQGAIKPGGLVLADAEVPGTGHEVWLLATKDDWRHPSQLEWIDNGLQGMVMKIKELEISSVALPAIGCGLGGLRWRDVRYLIEKYFGELDRWLAEAVAPEFTLWVYEPSENGPARRRGGNPRSRRAG